jgi:uncharacterized protein YndB with AHSA1/START domain
MEEQSAVHSTFVIERSYPATPERVFAAFADPVKKRRWYIEGEGRDVQQFEMDFRVGGQEHSRFLFKEGTPIAGMTLTNEGCFQDIIPGRRIVLSYAMSMNGKCFSASLATFEFLPTATGTDLLFTHQGVFLENADGPKMREAGWNTLFTRLAAEFAQ